MPFVASSGVDAVCSVAASRRSTKDQTTPIPQAHNDDARRFAMLRRAMSTSKAKDTVSSGLFESDLTSFSEAEGIPPTQVLTPAVAPRAEVQDPAVVCRIALATPLTVEPSASNIKPAKPQAKQFGSFQEELAAAVKARQESTAAKLEPPQLQTEKLSSQDPNAPQPKRAGREPVVLEQPLLSGAPPQLISTVPKGPPPPPPLPPKHFLAQQTATALSASNLAPPPPPAPPKGLLSAAKIDRIAPSGAATPASIENAKKSAAGLSPSGPSQSPAKVSIPALSHSALSQC